MNFVDSSPKRHFELKATREEEIQELIAIGQLEICRGANRTCTLQWTGTTRWGSHFHSITSLIELFGSVQITLDHKMENALVPIQGEAKGILKAMMSFDFVFCLLLMHGVMKITELLCETLQRKSIDILHALRFVEHTKSLLQDMREDGWAAFVGNVESFCETYNIDMPDMSARYMDGIGHHCQKRNFTTNEHYYHVDVYNVVLDFQLSELN